MGSTPAGPPMARSLKPGTRNYNFMDMAGVRIGRVVVTSEASSACGNARWHCQCDCGGTFIDQGIHLRSVMKSERLGKRKYPFSCPECRPKRKGTYQRRT